MNTILVYILKIVQIVIVTIALLVSSLSNGYLPSLNSLETAWQTVWQGAQPPGQTPAANKNNPSNSNFQNNNRLRRRTERIAQGLRSLPATSAGSGQLVATNVYLSSGDRGVSSSRLTQAGQVIRTISLPTLNSVLGLTPAKPINIILFSSATTYGNSLLKAGVAADSINSIVSDTGGLTVGTSIWIPLYNLQDNSDLANVLSHELFHACSASQGFEDKLPIWLNEGTAWRIGLTAMQTVNSQKTSLEMAYYEADVKKAAQSGTLLPLTASEDEILKAQYNVEYEDFMAVEQLIKQYGSANYKAFIQNLKTKTLDQDFQDSFHTSITDFQAGFLKTL